MTAQDPALTKALDQLTLQVNRDNVLAAHKAFRDHAEKLANYLIFASAQTQMGLCGGDPVSAEAVGDASFGGKIRELLNVHRLHQQELVVAADHLREMARSYGITEEEITRSLKAPSGAG